MKKFDGLLLIVDGGFSGSFGFKFTGAKTDARDDNVSGEILDWWVNNRMPVPSPKLHMHRPSQTTALLVGPTLTTSVSLVAQANTRANASSMGVTHGHPVQL